MFAGRLWIESSLTSGAQLRSAQTILSYPVLGVGWGASALEVRYAREEASETWWGGRGGFKKAFPEVCRTDLGQGTNANFLGQMPF